MTVDTKPRYDGVSRDLEQTPGLGVAERVTSWRWSPRRNRWARVAEFDRRAGELEQRQATINAELSVLHERRANAPADYAQRLSQWELSDRKGPRPESQVEALDAQIAAGQAEFDGLVLAVAEVFEAKVSYVRKHRRRLEDEADRDVDAAHELLTAALGEVARAREQLVECREAALWARLFPAEDDTGEQIQTNLLTGGMRRPQPQEAHLCAYGVLGLVSQLRIDRLLEALRIDAAWLKTAATPAQRAALEGRNPRDRGGTVWEGTPEAHEQHRIERERALERYRAEWGRDPE